MSPVNAPAAVFAVMLIVGSIVPAVFAEPKPTEADLILNNGKFVTLEKTRPEAAAMAISGDTIMAVGDAAEIATMAGESTRTIDLGGRLVLPGLIESHAHLLGLGQARLKLDLVGTHSEAEIVALVVDRAAAIPKGRWILGRGWDQNDWRNTAFPTHRSLSRAAPDHPICLTRVDGHMVWINAKAMELAGISADTPDPKGGRLERGEDRAPTGLLLDNAIELVSAVIPDPTRDELKEALLLAIRECNSLGITSFHDAGAGREIIGLYEELIAEGQLTLRLNVMLTGTDRSLLQEYYLSGPRLDLEKHLLTVRSIKLFADGALGSRGAALLEDYADDPGNRGLYIESEDRLFRVSYQALDYGFQVCTHAIGDGANRRVLDAYERAFKSRRVGIDRRFRIEHAQILDEADIPRFEKLGVIPSMQAQHCTSDMPWVPQRIGDLRAAEGAYVWQKLLALGLPIPNGSDAPVESVDPLLGIYAAVTRQDREGNPPGGWYPDQCMTRTQAIESFTIHGAYASFEEEIKGRLKPGMLADLVVFSKDITTIPAKEILEARVLATIVGGQVVYDRLGGDSGK